MKKEFLCFVSAVATLSLTGKANADTVVYNSFGPGQTYDTSGVNLFGPSNQPDYKEVAYSFTVSQDGTVSGIDLALGAYYPSGGPSQVNVILRTDDNFAPGQIIAPFSQSADVTSPGIYTFTYSSPVFLQAQTVYWIDITTAQGTGTTWFFNPQTNLYNPSAEIDGYEQNDWQVDIARLAAFDVRVKSPTPPTTVPSPASAAIFGIALLARKRRSRNSFGRSDLTVRPERPCSHSPRGDRVMALNVRSWASSPR